MTSWEGHPAVRAGKDLSIEERFAVKVRDGMGSLRFIVWQTAIMMLWVAVNLSAFVYRWDPYPFILLNLMFSVQAAYASPFILLAQKRADIQSAELAQHAYETGERDFATDTETNAMVREIKELLRKQQSET